MLFNSFDFLIFFPVITIIYYVIPHKMRWSFLLVASYFFYMNWEPIYALLIFLSTLITYVCSYQMDIVNSQRNRKVLMVISIVLNFGILFLFKYYNFLTESMFNLLSNLGIRLQFPEFKFLLPVGISFYTFQAVGYSIDVYNKKLLHEKHFGKYALFVSFFPQLVAGPIERASNLLPQFSKVIKFDYKMAIEGTKLIIWGFFMKVVVADRLSLYVDSIYNNANMHSSVSLILATFFFAIQIYCDFGGYSNIAVGCAKIMGFELMTNFRRPYFSKSPSEFWHRWHISLSTWFKDYVYIPLGGNRVSNERKYFNLIVTFIVSGLWHGANWTFVIWGGLNGIYQVLLSLFKFGKTEYRKNKFISVIQVLYTFVFINFAWIFFRANSISDATIIIKKMVTLSGQLYIGNDNTFTYGIFGIAILLIKDLYDEFNIKKDFVIKRYYKYIWYTLLVISILMLGVFDGSQFIYFQF
jgi:alginate O-acetyltransferase complex protein AlgI